MVVCAGACFFCLQEETSKEDFIKMRDQRDSALDVPVLILPSVQVNICAGRLPQPQANDIAYLKIPVNVL